MIGVELSLRQADCPLSAASAAQDVAFVTPHWHYHRDQGRLELRMLVDASSRGALETGLETVRDHPSTVSFDLLAKQTATARARLTMGTTEAMGTVVDHDGYLTGPFRNVDGTERWSLGFDTEAAARGALSALERNTDDQCTVTRHEAVTPSDALEHVHADTVGRRLLEAQRHLTTTERKTIERALETGYYEVPRATTLSDLAESLEVSDAAVSKTLRRAESKLLSPSLERSEWR
ncbi:helix-turn-helix domain-containing protein [Halobacteria archaeon AArc-curdl1]|uniref:Helix-turn-helix domain-containing protein n=1 Tax=Natronosalvus hydrolyticus TaxID=2979988 RepID=A0AAP3E791_9EURY|nr:helix-turn-helix domain-containing protein [Halobacteria archaeon AArc-curdl1]